MNDLIIQFIIERSYVDFYEAVFELNWKTLSALLFFSVAKFLSSMHLLITGLGFVEPAKIWFCSEKIR